MGLIETTKERDGGGREGDNKNNDCGRDREESDADNGRWVRREAGRKCGAFQDSLREARFSENIMAEKRIFFPTLNMIKIQGEILLHTPVK